MRSKLKFILALCLMGYIPYTLQAQNDADSLMSKPWLSVTQSTIFSGKKALPFWFFSNSSSRLEEESYLGSWTSLELTKLPNLNKHKLSSFYGFEVNGFLGTDSRFAVTQAFVGLKTKPVRFSLGMQEEFFGLNDSTLSIGNLFYGNNASPIPKVALSTNGWIKAPLLGKVLSFNAYFAHGWLEKNRFQSGALLHQKYFYLKGEFLNKRLQLIGGLHHAAHWGGKNDGTNTRQPKALADFYRIVFALKGRADADQSDQLNALGNHLGSYDLRGSIRLNKITISNYWQFLWEDNSGLNPLNWRDGLMGLSIKSNSRAGLVSGFNLEIIRTTDQDAFKIDDNGNPRIEPDDFFNNTIYRDAWTYQKKGISSPIFLILNPESKSFAKVKNRVNGVNIATEGIYRQFKYSLQYRHFKNSGTHYEDFTPRLELSSIEVQLSVPVKKAMISMRGIIEWGNYPGKNAGLIISYTRKIRL